MADRLPAKVTSRADMQTAADADWAAQLRARSLLYRFNQSVLVSRTSEFLLKACISQTCLPAVPARSLRPWGGPAQDGRRGRCKPRIESAPSHGAAPTRPPRRV